MPAPLFLKGCLKLQSHLNHLQVRTYLVPTMNYQATLTLRHSTQKGSRSPSKHGAVARAYPLRSVANTHTLPPPLYPRPRPPASPSADISCGRASCILGSFPQVCPCPPWPESLSKVKLQNLSVPSIPVSFSHCLRVRKIIHASL